jgi:hypothetical protein
LSPSVFGSEEKRKFIVAGIRGGFSRNKGESITPENEKKDDGLVVSSFKGPGIPPNVPSERIVCQWLL